jgi:plasmid stability protein
MAAITIRNLSDEAHRALKVRAAQHGRSTEAEIRDILEKVAKPEGRIRLGTILAEIGRDARLTDEEWDKLKAATERDGTPVQPPGFE